MRALVMTAGNKQQKIPWCLKTALFCVLSVYRASLHGSGVLVTTTTQQGVGESHYRGVRTPQPRTVIHNNIKTLNVNFRSARRQRKPKFKRLLKVHVHFAAGCTTGWTKRFENPTPLQMTPTAPIIHIGLHPQNRKYIAYRNAARSPLATRRKSDKVWTCGSWDMCADRQTRSSQYFATCRQWSRNNSKKL